MSDPYIAITVEYTDPKGKPQRVQVSGMPPREDGSIKIPALINSLIAAGGVARIHTTPPIFDDGITTLKFIPAKD